MTFSSMFHNSMVKWGASGTGNALSGRAGLSLAVHWESKKLRGVPLHTWVVPKAHTMNMQWDPVEVLHDEETNNGHWARQQLGNPTMCLGNHHCQSMCPGNLHAMENHSPWSPYHSHGHCPPLCLGSRHCQSMFPHKQWAAADQNCWLSSRKLNRLHEWATLVFKWNGNHVQCPWATIELRNLKLHHAPSDLSHCTCRQTDTHQCPSMSMHMQANVHQCPSMSIAHAGIVWTKFKLF